jgi:hypothetical protein
MKMEFRLQVSQEDDRWVAVVRDSTEAEYARCVGSLGAGPETALRAIAPYVAEAVTGPDPLIGFVPEDEQLPREMEHVGAALRAEGDDQVIVLARRDAGRWTGRMYQVVAGGKPELREHTETTSPIECLKFLLAAGHAGHGGRSEAGAAHPTGARP